MVNSCNYNCLFVYIYVRFFCFVLLHSSHFQTYTLYLYKQRIRSTQANCCVHICFSFTNVQCAWCVERRMRFGVIFIHTHRDTMSQNSIVFNATNNSNKNQQLHACNTALLCFILLLVGQFKMLTVCSVIMESRYLANASGTESE